MKRRRTIAAFLATTTFALASPRPALAADETDASWFTPIVASPDTALRAATWTHARGTPSVASFSPFSPAPAPIRLSSEAKTAIIVGAIIVGALIIVGIVVLAKPGKGVPKP